jgi:hypothetical protein
MGDTSHQSLDLALDSTLHRHHQRSAKLYVPRVLPFKPVVNGSVWPLTLWSPRPHLIPSAPDV